MRTEVLTLTGDGKDLPKIRQAAKALTQGALVAFPTETVYGLGANALDEEAVERIFEAKGRAKDNPLIAHVADTEDLEALAREVPERARDLVEKYWPGPLTLVLDKSDSVPKVTTCGLETVAVRMPANEVALALIRESGVPVAAPSANLSGKPSPTCAQHVLDDLSGRIDYVIDAGRTRIGVESTVLDLTTEPATMLRPGAVTLDELRKTLGEVALHMDGSQVKSPGMKYRHYSPKAKVIVADAGKVQGLADRYMGESLKVGVMAADGADYRADVVRHVGADHEQIAKNLYDTLRGFDVEEVDVVIAEDVGADGLGHAIMNRLTKASHD